MFGELPAYGFYVRHVKGLRFSNVRLRSSKPDLRHAVMCEDVADLAVDGLDAKFWPGAAPMLSLIQTHGAIIRGCQLRGKDTAFLQITGDTTSNVALVADDLEDGARSVTIGPEVMKGAVSVK